MIKTKTVPRFASILLASCIALGVSTPVNAAEKITVWSWDVAAEALMNAATSYNAQQTDVTVAALDKGYSPVYDQLTAGCAAGGINLPDVVSIENGEAERYLQQFPDCFVDLKQFGVEKIRDKFPVYKWVELESEGGIYGVPWDSGQVVTFYRRDILKDAGIDPAQLATWDGYIAAGKQLLKATDGKVKMAVTNYTQGLNWFGPMAQQNDCSIFAQEGDQTVIRINQPGCVQALDKLKQITDSGIIMPGGWDDHLKALKTSTAATSIYGAWFEGSLRGALPEQKGQWGIVKMPAHQAGGIRAANLGGSSLFIPITAKNPAAAYKFIEYAMANQSAQIEMLKSSGLVPSLLSATKDKYISSGQPYWGDQAIWKLILETTDQIKAIKTTRYGAEATDIVIAIQSAFIEGKYANAQEALDKAAKQIKNATGLPMQK
ncbi:MAG: extracellular solute-binding protein [Osedax symbiont Rs1]|nr:MAG: extracellular solute-binding protein [Osedax symbiont Rs1]